MSNLQNPIFTDDAKAREWLEARVWPDGPVCPHCGVTAEFVTKLQGEKHRPGVYQCNACREQFTVTVKTVFERSKVPLSKWLAALFLLTASKKGVSAHQVHRSLGISYKTAWFMMNMSFYLPGAGNWGTTSSLALLAADGRRQEATMEEEQHFIQQANRCYTESTAHAWTLMRPGK